MKEKVVLAYSGGLDTSVAIKWLIEKGYEVVACCLDVGEKKDLDFIKQKSIDMGATETYIIDAKEEFAQEFVKWNLAANGLYEGVYPLVSALSRPLISKKLVEIAEQVGATTVVHGCTGKGNDQVRFEVSIAALNPNLKILAPVREWKWSREEEIEYAKEHGVPVPADLDNPYSVDQNLWGRAIEAGVLENPWVAPPEGAYQLTKSLEDAPNTPEYVEIDFEKGIPVALNGEKMILSELIQSLNAIAGNHGVGRIDHIENRMIGIKSREVYECPAAITLITAHKALEDLTLVKETAHFKTLIEDKLNHLIYEGLWFNPLTDAIKAFLASTQETVTGTVRVKLFKGHAIVDGRKSPISLYDENLATYTSADTFDQAASVGFIKIFGLPTKVQAEVQNAKK